MKPHSNHQSDYATCHTQSFVYEGKGEFGFGRFSEALIHIYWTWWCRSIETNKQTNNALYISYFLLLFTLEPRTLPGCPAMLRHVEQLRTIPSKPCVFRNKDDSSWMRKWMAAFVSLSQSECFTICQIEKHTSKLHNICSVNDQKVTFLN